MFIARLPSNLRPTTRECLHLVTRGHFRLRDKDGGHTIRFAIVENPTIHANLMALSFTEPELWAIKVLQCGNMGFRLICSCNLELNPMTFMYELDPYSLEIYTGFANMI